MQFGSLDFTIDRIGNMAEKMVKLPDSPYETYSSRRGHRNVKAYISINYNFSIQEKKIASQVYFPKDIN